MNACAPLGMSERIGGLRRALTIAYSAAHGELYSDQGG